MPLSVRRTLAEMPVRLALVLAAGARGAARPRAGALLVAAALALGACGGTRPSATLRAPTATAACTLKAGDRRVDGVLLHVPERARPPLPLVLAFHGAGGTGDGFAAYSGLSEAADAYGFAVLYPSASRNHFWSLNRAMGTRDLEALRALVPRALAAACGDPRRVFATGVSNGGGFAAR